MDVQSIMETNFLYLDLDWTVKKARELVEGLEPAYVIIHRVVPINREYYYLFSAKEILKMLHGQRENKRLRKALELHEDGSVDPVDPSAGAGSAPGKFVAVEDGRPVGYLDTSRIPAPPPMFGSIPPAGGAGVGAIRGLGSPAETAGEASPADVERQLRAEFPEKVAVEDTASLLVYITTDVQPGVGIGLTQAVGTVLDIVVQARRGFAIEGRNEGKLTVTSEEETLPLQFTLRATETGPGDVRVLVFQQGQPVGMIRLAPSIVAQLPAGETRSVDTREQPLAPATVKLPDLQMFIEETQVNGTRGFILRLSSPDPSMDLNFARFGPVLLQSDPGKYFEAFYTDIEGYSIRTKNDRAMTAQKLADKGSLLFTTLFPEEAQKRLWELKERITTVIVQSEEPWIPWELCRLVGEKDGEIVDGAFFCEQFAVTRWIPGIGFKPALSMKNIAVVAPGDSGLPFAPEELSYLESLAGSDRAVTRVPARFLDLHKAFKSGKFDAWHFTGHGGARDLDPNRATMLLENKEEFRPENISGVAANLGRSRPLVFLNACQIGRGGMTLTDVGGWARQFLSVGAGAFIGAYWSIYDMPACNFTSELYDSLLAGVPVGKAVQEARQAIRSAEDPTWLAYTVFADPMAVVKEEG